MTDLIIQIITAGAVFACTLLSLHIFTKWVKKRKLEGTTLSKYSTILNVGVCMILTWNIKSTEKG